MAILSKNGYRDSSRRTLLVVSLVVVALLLSSLLVYVWFGVNAKQIHVRNEVELRRAVDNARSGVSVNIILDSDISLLDGPLVIPYEKNITLSSNSNTEFFKLIGTYGYSTIFVDGNKFSKLGGVLIINGIIVTHPADYNSGDVDAFGVTVGSGGTFILLDGEISNNVGTGACGVQNSGVFEMYGGIISSNIATYYGGGVYNVGIFKMFGGEIVYNTARQGGGVFMGTMGHFEMYGGVISGNTATEAGGGVHASSSFSMMGGVISGNTARNGGGVYLDYTYSNGSFYRSGGEISGNTAEWGDADVSEVKTVAW